MLDFLEYNIDEKLQWNEHINQISAKVSKNIGILKKTRGQSNLTKSAG